MMRRRILYEYVPEVDEYMELISQYTITESWESDTYGNAYNAWNTIMLPVLNNENLSSKYNLYVGVFTNNNASNASYKADYMYYTGNNNLSVSDFVTYRNGRTNRQVGAASNRSFYASVGTVVKIYRLYSTN